MRERVFSILLQYKTLATCSFCGLFLLNLLFESDAVNQICIVLVSSVLILSLFQVRGVSRIIGYLLFGVSILLLVAHKAPLSVWMDGIDRNIYMLVMFALTPLMNLPLSKGGYSEALQNFLAIFLDRKSSFAMFIKSLSALSGVILNVATIPLMLTIGSQQKKEPDYRLLCTSIARGYSLALLWGPAFAAVALPLELTGVKWSEYFPWAIGASLLILLSGYAFSRLQERGQYPKTAAGKKSGGWSNLAGADRKKLRELALWWAAIFSFIIIFSAATGINTISVVSITSIIFPPLWMTLIHHLDIYKTEFTQGYLKRDLPNMNAEIVLFAGAGLLSTSFEFSHAVDFIPALLARLTGGNALAFIILALFVIVLLSIAGIHVMIPVIILGSSITPEAYGLTPMALTFILTAGWAMSVFLSSSGTVPIIIASFMRTDTFSVSVRWNWKYGLYVFALFCTFIYIINLLT